MLTAVRTNWYDGTIVQPSEMDALDNNTAAALNPDAGGTWNPSSAIILQAATGYTGPVFKALGIIDVSGGLIQTPLGSGARITFGDSDYYLLPSGHPGRVRTFMEQTLESAFAYGAAAESTGGQISVQTLLTGATLALPLRVHHNATLSTVTVDFIVGSTHSNVPANLPKFRVVAVDATGNKTPMTSTASGADANGWVVFTPTPSTGAAWYAGGAVQTLAITCDQSNWVQTNLFGYVLEIQDEGGTHSIAGNIYVGVSAAFTLIYDLRYQN